MTHKACFVPTVDFAGVALVGSLSNSFRLTSLGARFLLDVVGFLSCLVLFRRSRSEVPLVFDLVRFVFGCGFLGHCSELLLAEIEIPLDRFTDGVVSTESIPLVVLSVPSKESETIIFCPLAHRPEKAGKDGLKSDDNETNDWDVFRARLRTSAQQNSMRDCPAVLSGLIDMLCRKLAGEVFVKASFESCFESSATADINFWAMTRPLKEEQVYTPFGLRSFRVLCFEPGDGRRGSSVEEIEQARRKDKTSRSVQLKNEVLGMENMTKDRVTPRKPSYVTPKTVQQERLQ